MVQRKFIAASATFIPKLLGFTIGFVCCPVAAFGQIAPSAGVGSTGTVVAPGCTNCSITGGAEVGSNLFHSFDRFSIPTNGSAVFRIGNNPDLINPGSIQRVFARVVGGEITSIDGLLQVENNADLFLLNPNGLVVGENATLSVGGSFVGSTAQAIEFADGSVFGTRETLLTVTAPIGLQLGRTPGQIMVRGGGHNLFTNPDFSINRDLRTLRSQGLVSGQTLALIGGDVVFDGGNLTAPGGRVVVGAGAGGTVEMVANRLGYSFDYAGLAELADIRLVNAASIDTSAPTRGGQIHLRGQDIQILDGSNLLANTTGTGVGGHVAIAADSLFLAGFVPPPISAFPLIAAIQSGINVDVEATSSARGGQLNLQVGILRVEDGAQITADIFGQGQGADIIVNAETIELIGDLPIGPSAILTNVGFGVTGQGGDIVLHTHQLRVLNGAQAGTRTYGPGNAGNFIINAQTVDVLGFSNGSDFNGNQTIPSLLTTAAEIPPAGAGGTLQIDTDRLRVANGGQIATSTASFSAPAGDLFVNANTIELSGQTSEGRSGLFASALFGEGAGGTITVTAEELSVLDGATINVSNFPSSSTSRVPPGFGAAGNINLDVARIFLDNGLITADTVSGNRANIYILSDLLLLQNQSRISTNATGSATGGNIVLDTEALVAFRNSDITANAQANFGGRVDVTANAIVGTEFRSELTPDSDITASSALGAEFSGVVEINSPDVDPSQGVEPEQRVENLEQIVATCEQLSGNEFVIAGRGGLPADPSQVILNQSVWQDLRLTAIASNTSIEEPKKSIAVSAAVLNSRDRELADLTETSPVEARGWIVDHNGNLMLVATMPTNQMFPPASHLVSAGSCRDEG
ncbi:MAG: two-partner secretion domain-containing protein [Thainema sp.]